MGIPPTQDFYASDRNNCWIWNPAVSNVAGKVQDGKIELREGGKGGQRVSTLLIKGIEITEEYQNVFTKQDYPAGYLEYYSKDPRYAEAFWKIAWPKWEFYRFTLIKLDGIDDYRTYWNELKAQKIAKAKLLASQLPEEQELQSKLSDSQIHELLEEERRRTREYLKRELDQYRASKQKESQDIKRKDSEPAPPAIDHQAAKKLKGPPSPPPQSSE